MIGQRPIRIHSVSHISPFSPSFVPGARSIRIGSASAKALHVGRPRKMGSNFNVSEIPTSAMIAAGGGLAAYLAGILPEVPKIVVRSLGFLAVGYSIYRLFESTAEAAAEEEKSSAIPKKESFSAVSGQFTQPRTYETIDFEGFSGNKYTAKLLVANPSKDTITFRVRLWAEETPFSIFGKQEPNNGTVAEIPVTLNPGEQKTLQFELSTVTSAFKVNAIASLWIKLKAQKIGTAGQTMDLAKVEFFGE